MEIFCDYNIQIGIWREIHIEPVERYWQATVLFQ